ncbi:MAG: hypothetical protein KGL74_14660 [Elusimicrobia bacterium]|nr:hypothetical protein [Elusimicrobiota bacterium]
MKALAAALLLLLATAPAVRAQAPRTKSARSKRAPKALTSDSPEMSRRIFAAVDASIAQLAAAVRAARDCVSDGEYLRKDLAATEARLKAAGGGAIPSNQAALVVIKQGRLSRERNFCAARSKELLPLFDAAAMTLARTEPQSHPGIKLRKEKIAALRAQANEIYVLLGGKAPVNAKSPEPSNDDSAR